MEKKEYTPLISLAVAIISFLGFLGCGIACLALNQALKVQRHDVSQARAQLLALDQALKIQQHDLSEAREQMAAATNKIADAQEQNQSLSQQLTEIQSKLHESKTVAETHFPPVPFAGAGPIIPAADSVEAKLRSEGKHWERAEGQPVPGGYVQDLLQGRLNQPIGRGEIGKVMAVGVNDDGRPGAVVDFGRGFSTGIMFSELSPVRLVGPEMR
jgi:hypothetical protein